MQCHSCSQIALRLQLGNLVRAEELRDLSAGEADKLNCGTEASKSRGEWVVCSRQGPSWLAYIVRHCSLSQKVPSLHCITLKCNYGKDDLAPDLLPRIAAHGAIERLFRCSQMQTWTSSVRLCGSIWEFARIGDPDIVPYYSYHYKDRKLPHSFVLPVTYLPACLPPIYLPIHLSAHSDMQTDGLQSLHVCIGLHTHNTCIDKVEMNNTAYILTLSVAYILTLRQPRITTC